MLVSRVVGPGESAVAKFADPVAGPGEAVVLVRACGVCASEFPAWLTGDAKGSTLGHEVAGEVIAIGPSVSSVRPGDRVTGLLSDGFAEQTVGCAAELVRLPPGLSFAHALGEPLGCVMHAIGRLPSLEGMRVAVVGLGFMGLSCLGVLRSVAAGELVAVSSRAMALERARNFGASSAVRPDQLNMRDRVATPRADPFDGGFDVVIEASGTQGSLDLASELVAAHGTLLIVGYHQGGSRSVDLALWNWKGLQVINGHVRRRAEQVEAIVRGVDLIRKGRFSFAPLVTQVMPLTAVDTAFQLFSKRSSEVVKTVIVPAA